MLERPITEEEVKGALEHPLEVIQIRYGRKAACGRLSGGKYVVVIFEEAEQVYSRHSRRGGQESREKGMASLEFDKQVNALYLRLRKGKIFSSEPLADNIIIDLDEKKKVLGLELLLPSTIKKEIKAQLTSRR